MEFVSRGARGLTGYDSSDLLGNQKVSYGQLSTLKTARPYWRRWKPLCGPGLPFGSPTGSVRRKDRSKWVWEQGCGVYSDQGELQALEGFVTDITEARRAEENAQRLLVEQTARVAAEAAEKRAAFLSDASRILGSSFDYRTTLATLARLTVPYMADYCKVDLIENGADLLRVGVAHVDPGREGLLLELAHPTVDAIPREHPLFAALFERRSTLVPEITGPMVRTTSGDEEHRLILDRLHPRSSITVPLVISNRVVGAVTLARSEVGRAYSIQDLEVAEELARRAALAVENSCLFHEAQRATQARDRILAVVAHDLRNPLGTIMMTSELLVDLEADATRRRQLGIIRRSAGRMNHLVEDLFEVSRIGNGHLTVEPSPATIQPLIDESVAMLRPLAAARSIALTTDLEAGLPLVLYDVSRILQVISNLIGNAVKFTPPQGEIGIRCERRGGEVRFAIADTGTGIAPEQLPHLFGELWQASADRRGMGLGLSIAEGIVEAHGGRIWAESEQGAGSTFYFTLPVASG
jgi:signal transduction histidine kinase